jgi:hypothetical protein
MLMLSRTETSAFWTLQSLDEWGADQEVSPITELSELDAICSVGDAFDDALSELLKDRRERRRRAMERAGRV